MIEYHNYLHYLDGLRALAIISVLIYHNDNSWLSGGFLGVEIFFVISGFIITYLLFKEWQNSHQINFLFFYQRRILRLLPAILGMLLIVWIWLLFFHSDDLEQLYHDLPYSLSFTVNLAYILNEKSYFETVDRPPLLQHLWSLGIEFQFYLIWPLICLMIFRLRLWLQILILILSASFSTWWMIHLYALNIDPARIYFGTDTRLSAFLIGAIVAIYTNWNIHSIRGFSYLLLIKILTVISYCSLLLFLFFLTSTHSWLYRGGFLFTSVCTAILIICCQILFLQDQKNVITSILNSRYSRFIGMRAYSIYLWHWPIFCLTEPGVDIPLEGFRLFLLRVGFTLLLANISYRYVETQLRYESIVRLLRNFPNWGRQQFALITVGACFLIMFFFITPLINSSHLWRNGQKKYKSDDFIEGSSTLAIDSPVEDNPLTQQLTPAIIQQPTPPIPVQLVIGSSQSLNNGLKAYRLGQFRRAYTLLEPIARQGEAQAQFILALMYSNGDGVELDEYQAAHWFELAALQGHLKSQYFLAILYEQGWGIASSKDQAIYWYQRCMAQADPNCRLRLEQIDSRHNPQIPPVQLTIGSSQSLNNGLKAYRLGQFRRAYTLLEPIARQGEAQAQFILALMYSNGNGVELDEYQAAHWFELAALQGHLKSQYFLAILYEQGWGVASSKDQAIYWYQRCMAQADPNCRLHLEQIDTKQPPLAKTEIVTQPSHDTKIDICKSLDTIETKPLTHIRFEKINSNGNITRVYTTKNRNATVFAIGDSVMVGAARELVQQIPGLAIDAQVGRQLIAGKKILTTLQEEKQLGDIVIIHLGNNGPLNKIQLEDLIQILKHARYILLVNLKLPRNYETLNNNLLASVDAQYPHVYLVDWQSFSKQGKNIFVKDGFHLTSEGAKLYTTVIRDFLCKIID